MTSVLRVCVRCVALWMGAALIAALPAVAGDAVKAVKILRAIPIASTVDISADVRKECEIDTKVPNFLKEYAGDKVEVVDAAPDHEKGRVLEMEITEVWATGGGAWSGPKWMTVMGHLYEDGKETGSFRAKRFSTGGMFAGFKGTCTIIGRCTKEIGKDISKWIEAPTANALLGDAKD